MSERVPSGNLTQRIPYSSGEKQGHIEVTSMVYCPNKFAAKNIDPGPLVECNGTQFNELRSRRTDKQQQLPGFPERRVEVAEKILHCAKCDAVLALASGGPLSRGGTLLRVVSSTLYEYHNPESFSYLSPQV